MNFSPNHQRERLTRVEVWGKPVLVKSQLLLAAGVALLISGVPLRAGNLTRGGVSTSSGSAGGTTSQTSTAASTATAQSSVTSILAQRAQASLQRSLVALQTLHSQQNAQITARNLALGATSSNNGLVSGGLVPGLTSSDASVLTTSATSLPVTSNANGTASVTLAPNSGLTLPTNFSGTEQITVSGAGSVGTVTTGGTITTLTGGAVTTISPGSTISVPSGGTVTFTGGSTDAIPKTVSTYNYGTTANPSPVPASWAGIGGLSQSTYAAPTSPAAGRATGGQTTVTVTQTAPQALLNWLSFNVGKNTVLDFDQSAGGADVGSWVALNKVAANIAPSQILGIVQAPGQVYVINQNGIIFGGSSQVNAGALVASSLPINDNLAGYYNPTTQQYVTGLGLLNNPDDQFLFSQLNIQANALGNGTPLFYPEGGSIISNGVKTVVPASAPAPTSGTIVTQNSGGVEQVAAANSNGQDGDVVVQPGAQLSTPTTPEHVGGKIALVGPNVDNGGTLSSPDGQVILAAGLQVGFAASTDKTLRGLNVTVGPVTDPTYDAQTFDLTSSSNLSQETSFTLPSGTPGDDSLVFSSGGTTTESVTVGKSTTVTTTAFAAGSPLNGLPAGTSVQLYSPGTATLTAGSTGGPIPIVLGATVNGAATNAGDIEAPRADVMITGQNVNQLGVINSTTSVALNGRVDLLANYGATLEINGPLFSGSSGLYTTMSGAVTIGADTLTQIQPEVASTATAVGTTLPLLSQMNIQGKTIYLGADSQILAPNANLTFTAGEWQALTSGVLSGYNLSYTTGQVYLDTGATVDVSGSENVSASVADNIIPVQLLGTELANSPLQQNGALRGQTVYVDITQTGVYNGTPWIGTPLGNVSGYVNLVGHTAGELTTAGGTVAIIAGGSVVMQPGSTVDVSGGWTNYAGATVQTTELLSGGSIINISQATPNLVYSGIYNGGYTTSSSKWGTSQTYSDLSNAIYEPGYVQGANGGSISITAPSVALDGTLMGTTVAGPHQTTPISQLSNTYSGATFLPTTLAAEGVPTSSSLFLNIQAQEVLPDTGVTTVSPTPPNIVFENGPSGLSAVGAFAVDSTGDPLPLPTDRSNNLVLSPDLVNSDGFGTLSIANDDGNITVPADVSLTAPLGGSVLLSASSGTPVTTPESPGSTTLVTTPVAGGSITFDAANIYIEGKVAVPGGNIQLSTYSYSPFISLPEGTDTPTSPTAASGNFVLGNTAPGSTSAASLSTAGLVIDNSSAASTLPTVINGGTVKISSYSTDLMPGTTVNVSGGAVVAVGDKVTYGQGGAINISGGADSKYSSLVGGSLSLGSSLEGYASGIGGSLTITAPLIQIGGDALQNGDTSGHTLWLNPTDQSGNLIGPDFFSQGGFTNITLNGLGLPTSPAVLIANGISPANGTVIAPVAQSWQAVFGGAGVSLETTTPLLASARTPVSLKFDALGVSDADNSADFIQGNFVMATDASIVTDPLASVSIAGQTATVLGSITAPGGNIMVSGGSSFANAFGTPQLAPTVDLGPHSSLSSAGVIEITSNLYGYTTGSVLPGGSIKISGNIVAEPGSTLNVSGTAGTLDVQPSQVGLVSTVSSRLDPVLEDSNGGTITLAGGQELFTGATLLGAAGGVAGNTTAQGGTLNVSSGLFLPTVTSLESPLDPTLIVTQNASSLSVSDENTGLGYFAVDSFEKGGFESLSLGGTVQFEGNVSITAASSLTIATNPKSDSGGIILTDPLDAANQSNISLTAPYIDLGQTFVGPENALQSTVPYTDSAGNRVPVQATHGSGNLQVNATLIDVGNLSLQNIGQVSLTAANGDIRGDGTFEVSGTMNLTAGQIYPVTDTTFTLAAYDYTGGVGTISISGSGSRPLPLSAGGILNAYASTIDQGGVLRAPIGTINLGSGVTAASPVDPIGGGTFDATQNLTLAAGSTTSVSAVDANGNALDVPYGINVDGVQWNDPGGNAITTAGNGPNAIPAKTITLSAGGISDESGSSIDISGGGDIYAYEFVSGTGGTINVLNQANKSYAILPSSYSAIPQAAFSPGYATDGYSGSDSPVAVGEEVYLEAGSGLKAGYYTLLPSIYALQPGAYLVTAKGGVPPVGGTQVQADGSSLVAGTLVNGLNPASGGQQLLSTFQVDSPKVVSALADYQLFSGTTFLAQSALNANAATPRLPVDAGQLVLAAQASLSLGGSVTSNVPVGGQGSLVDITSSSPILIYGTNANLTQDTASFSTAPLELSSSALSAFGADSLLIGGYRGATTTAGIPVTVTTSELVVDNSDVGNSAQAPTNALAGPDVILVSNDTLTLDAGAQVVQGARTLSGVAPTLVLGSSTIAGSGDGTLLRVTSDPTAQFSRLNLDLSSPADLTIGANATISGASLALDSTHDASLHSSAALTGTSVAIDSGQINLLLNTNVTTPTTPGLILSGAALTQLQSTATDLSLLSYGSIDIYGNGAIGGDLDSAGQFPVASFALHAAAIRGDGNGTVTINAGNISINNSAGSVESGAGPTATPGGSLVLNAGEVQFGAVGQTAMNGVNIEGYDNVTVNASGGILLQSAGSTTTSTGTVIRGGFNLTTIGSNSNSGNLTLNTPIITGATAANQTITAGGALTIGPFSGTTTAPVVGGLGATVDLVGQTVADDSAISLASGTLKLEATNGNLIVGANGTSLLDVSGTTKIFNDVSEYTSGGTITLASDTGSISLASDATLKLSAPAGGGNAGSLNISAPNGNFAFDGSTMQGQAGAGGQGGAFSADVATVGVSSSLSNGVTNNNLGNDLTPLQTALNAGGFTQSQAIRVRGGTVDGVTYNDVYVNGATTASQVNTGAFNLSADNGSIIVTGTINASNLTSTDSGGNPILVGGTIDLTAFGSVVLTPTAVLTVAGQNFSNAGQGGSVTLSAGAYTSSGGTPAGTQTRDSTTGNFAAGTPVVDIQEGSTIDLSVIANSGSMGRTVDLTSSGSSFLNLPQATSFTLTGGTPGNDGIAFSTAGTVTSGGVTTPFAAGSTLTGLAAGSTIQLNAPGSVMFASGGTGGAIPLALGSNVNYTLGALGDATGTLVLQAPQTASAAYGANTDVQINPIKGTILNASSIVVEGRAIFDAAADGSIDNQETAVMANGNTFVGMAGQPASPSYTALLNSLIPSAGSNASLQGLTTIEPDAVIINSTGDLTLANTWDLSTYRFGPNNTAGALTLRAAGNIEFQFNNFNGAASLSDGFTGYDGSSAQSLWNATVMSGPSWSYQITAGADFKAADSNRVQSPGYLVTQNLGGSVELGPGSSALPLNSGETSANIVPQYYQVIRTGTGNITISAGQDVQLDNPLATIYTAGQSAATLSNFALPYLTWKSTGDGQNATPYAAAYTLSGGNVAISAQRNIGSYLAPSYMPGDDSGELTASSTLELPTSWLYRQGLVINGQFATSIQGNPIAATSWWVDFNNFFEGVGALGGGNVSLLAGQNVDNVDAAVPTNARMPGAAPSSSALIELGGGDLLVQAGNDINGGVYYVERGQGLLQAGGSIHSNSTRTSDASNAGDPATWLPTTLFLGQGSFELGAQGSIDLGSVANPFLLPQNINNSFFNYTYFSTYAPTDSVNVSSLTGSVTLKDNLTAGGSLDQWYGAYFQDIGNTAGVLPWLNTVETDTSAFDSVYYLLPPTLDVTSVSGDINLIGSPTLAPSAQGTLNLIAAGSINGYQPNGVNFWASATVNLSDANPASIPSVISPLSFSATQAKSKNYSPVPISFSSLGNLFGETGATDTNLQTQEALHTPGLLHAGDTTGPLRVYAQNGDISGLTLYSGKSAQVEAGQDITNIALYVQNVNADNITLVSAGRDLLPYDANSPLFNLAVATLGQNGGFGDPTSGDLQISGPGTLEILAGRNLNLGVNTSTGSSSTDGLGVGISSIGNQRDPYLPFGGADVVAAAGINSNPDYAAFIAQFLAPGAVESNRYLPDLGTLLGMAGASNTQIWTAYQQLSTQRQDVLALDIFYLVLRDAGRDHNDPSSPGGGTYTEGFAALSTLFPDTNLLQQTTNFTNNQQVTVGGLVYTFETSLPGQPSSTVSVANTVKIGATLADSIANLDSALASYGPGMLLTSREIKTENGGNISLLVPGGALTVGFDLGNLQPQDQGILTVDGGNINIFADGDVIVGTSRIFTLNGGNEILWSTLGNIAAGASSKTVQSAPPTRVVVDPQSGDVKTDLSGLATGGGIGVLEAVTGAQASDVDLIAPFGAVNAGDAGIRASGNLNIAAVQVINAGNIQVGGKSSGVPASASAPNVAGSIAAAGAAGSANNAASNVAGQQQRQDRPSITETPSIITVEILGYGGGDG